MLVKLQAQKVSRSIKAYLFILCVKAVCCNWGMKLSKGLRTFLVLLISSLGNIRKLWCISGKIIKCRVLQLNWDVHPWVFFGWTSSPARGASRAQDKGVHLKGLCVFVTSEGNCLQQSLFKLYFPQAWAISQSLCQAPPVVLWLTGDLVFVVSLLDLASST